MAAMILRALMILLLAPVVLFWTMALWYAGPSPGWLRSTLAGVCAAGLLGVLLFVPGRVAALGIFAAAFAVLMLWWSSLAPSGQKDWAADVARMPSAELDGERLVVRNVRNFDYRSETDFDARYEDRTYDLSKLVGLDLFMSYWSGPSIAHTIMSWEFEDAPPLAISIETRKDRSQQYSAIQGFFKQYELIYVVADERDVIRLRTNYRGEQVYLYRLAAPPERARALLLDYVARFDGLADQPAFYDALTQNCTTTIRNHVKHIDPGFTFDWRLLVNGYLDQLLWEKGSVNNSIPFEELRAKSRINERALAAGSSPDYARLIREGLPPRPPPRAEAGYLLRSSSFASASSPSGSACLTRRLSAHSREKSRW
jgi:hypothetical protein